MDYDRSNGHGGYDDRGDRHRSRRDDDRPPRRDRSRSRDRDRRRDRDDRYHDDRRRRHDDFDRGGGGRGRRDGGRGGRGGPQSPARRSPTPEGTIPISKRQRKFTAWDVKRPGFENYTAEQAKMTGIFNLPGQSGRPAQIIPGAMASFSMQALPPIHMKGSQGASGPVAVNTSYAKQARRLYVGNITQDVTEKNIERFFNQKLKEQGLPKVSGSSDSEEPVASVQIYHDKNYAFVEFRNPEEATAGMALDGVDFQGLALKIRRPKDYLGSEYAPAAHVDGLVSTQVPDSVNKIFIGGLPSYLNDEQVMELLTTFGELKSFNLVKEGGSGVSKGFAFCEFADPSLTDVACEGLNGMTLGDRTLVVQRAAIGANPLKSNAEAFADNPQLRADAGKPTQFLQMLNMVAPEELLDDEEYGEIVEDIRDECNKFGNVLDVKIPRPIKNIQGKIDSRASEGVNGLGKVFIKFENVDMCTEALKSIAGRQFGGRTIICAFVMEDTFTTVA